MVRQPPGTSRDVAGVLRLGADRSEADEGCEFVLITLATAASIGERVVWPNHREAWFQK
jgi:hypothetical protein